MKLIKPWVLLILICLASCSEEANIKQGHVTKIIAQTYTDSLFYSGTIQPARTVVITSPADGVVVDMPLQYGEQVKNGQLLFSLSSAKFLSDYKAALMQYIKAKNDFNNSQTQFSEAEFLHKNELISDDDFKMRQGNYYAARLALLQAKDSLTELIHQLNIKNIDLYQLTIADIDKITQALHLQTGTQGLEHLQILAPTAGVILSANKNEEETKKIMKGDVIKQGDVLAIIGDMQGLMVRVKVNELTINQLQVGQKVIVTGIAFEDELTGFIQRLDKQGEASAGGLPTFMVEVVVPKLTLAQQQKIHVGMSAKVEIRLENAAQILIPLAAITEKNGGSYVQVIDRKTHQPRSQMVKTGHTTTTSVTILSGLKEGDQLVIPD